MNNDFQGKMLSTFLLFPVFISKYSAFSHTTLLPSHSLPLFLSHSALLLKQDACYWSGILTFSTWLQHFNGLKSLAMLWTYEHFKYEMTILSLICKTLPSLTLGLQYMAVVSPSSPLRTDFVEMEPCWTLTMSALSLSLSFSQ